MSQPTSEPQPPRRTSPSPPATARSAGLHPPGNIIFGNQPQPTPLRYLPAQYHAGGDARVAMPDYYRLPMNRYQQTTTPTQPTPLLQYDYPPSPYRSLNQGTSRYPMAPPQQPQAHATGARQTETAWWSRMPEIRAPAYDLPIRTPGDQVPPFEPIPLATDAPNQPPPRNDDGVRSPMPQSPASSVAGWERLSHADASSDWDELSMTPPGENDSCASGSVKGGEDDEDVEDVCSDLDDVSSDDAGGEDVNSEDAGSDDASHDDDDDDDDDDNGEDEQSESASSSGLPELCDLSAESEDEVPPTTVQKEPKHRDIKPIEVVELSPIQEKEDDDSAVEHIEDIRAVSDEIRDIVAAMRSPRYMHDNIMRHARPAAFNYQHVGVFVPDATGFGTNTVSLRDGVNCYRDVEYFIDAAGAAQAIMSPKVLRENLHNCLSGAAHTWYTTELSPWEHHWATMGEGLAHWITLLRKRWGPTDAQAVRRFCNFKVTLVDTRMDRRRFVSVDGRWYVMKAVHICRQVGIDNTYGQLVWAYSRLTPQLQAMVQPPRRDESIDSFARRLFVVNFLVMAREC